MAERGIVIDLDEPRHCVMLIARLYQHLVRYTDLHVRHAVRLDHSPDGEEGQAHPLADRIAADEGYEPVVALMSAQERLGQTDAAPAVHRSLAAAYVHLLRRHDNRMRDVARHLMISLSYCYRRCAEARDLAVAQHDLPAEATSMHDDFVPGPWRRFRVLRDPVQLCFDFDVGAALFSAGASVLLP